MTKTELKRKTDEAVTETKTALQTVYDALNHGQQQKLLNDEAVAALFERYGVVT
ncbi:MAG: hypothetical protein IKL27_07155 [Oscillospiraceae bacterium]|nr:hypothetical protein [Oscillospiraceae bacterium]